MLDIIKQRRSIRRFTDQAVSKEDRDNILKAALLSPTSRSLEPLEYIVVEDTSVIQEMVHCKSHSVGAFKSAPLAIAILGNPETADTWIEDASIATIAMQLQIEKLGLGSCWIQMRLRTAPNGKVSNDMLRDLLGYPEKLIALAVLAIGHKAEEHPPYTDNDCLWNKVHYGKY